MKLIAPVYACTECKKIVNTLDKLLFIEDHSTKGFCSEECIEFFYAPLLKHYEELVFQLRTKYKLQNEIVVFDFLEQDLIEEVIRMPSEIWHSQNELHEELFSYIRHFPQASVAILCTVFNAEPSFIFSVVKTRSQDFLTEFRIGERLLTAQNSDNEEFLVDLENKKSNLLAELLSKRSDMDIPFEDFSQYDYCIEETLQNPDETFQFKDKEGDLLLSSIKSFNKNTKNIFYIIISFHNVTILAFPTEDINLYGEFRIGKQILSNLKN